MRLFNRDSYATAELTEDFIDSIESAKQGFGDYVLRTRPYKKGPGAKYGTNLINSLHEPLEEPSIFDTLRGNVDDPPRFSYELWFDNGKLTFNWTFPDDDDDYWYDQFRQAITGEYPKVGLQRVSRPFITYTPDDYVAGGELSLKSNQYVPIKGLDGHGQFDLEERKPLRQITSEIAGQQNVTACVQVLFEPAPPDWRDDPDGFRARDAETVAAHLKEGRVVESYIEPRLEDPTQKDLNQAEAINNHEGEPAFYVTIRYFVFSEDEERARKHAKQIGGAYQNAYRNEALNQRFSHSGFSGRDLKKQLPAAINRDFTDSKLPLTIPELGGVAHIPNEEIETPNVDWTAKGLGSQVPNDIPRKVDSIDPLPYDEFGPENDLQDNISSNAQPLPAPDDSDQFEPSNRGSETKEDEINLNEHIDLDVPEPGRLYINNEKHEAFLKLIQTIEQGNLKIHELDELIGKERAEEAKPHVEQEIKYREFVRTHTTLDPSVDLQTLKEDLADIPDEELDEGQQDEDSTDAETNPNLGNDREDVAATNPEYTDDNTRNVGSPKNLPARPEDYADADIDPIDVEREWQEDPHTNDDRAYEVKVKGRDGNWYLGRDVKNELFDIHETNPDSPLWLGYVMDNRVGVREVGIEEMGWFRHLTVFGMTGTGKSTFYNNLMVQVAKKGHGFVFIDPKGDGVRDIIQQIPDHRLDDVIWVEPGSTKYDKVVGINFLEAAFPKGHPNFNREVTSMVDDLTAILKGGDYWGPKMEGITTNIARAMIRSEINFTLMDMYYVLRSQESREAFAEMIKREGEKLAEEFANSDKESDELVDDMRNIQTYTSQIAEMDYEEVDAVVRRIQHWIEDPVARGVIAHREGTVNITEAVEEGKIILVNIDIDSADIKEVVATAIMRRVWAAIKARDEDEEDRTPFFSFIDEFDDVATNEMDMEKMLSKARSGKMGVALACQNPSQIPEATRKQMFANVRTLNTFGVGEPEDARTISTRYTEDVDYHQIMDIPQFNIFTRVLMNTEDGRRLSKPLPVNTFADYPPVRSPAAVDNVIEQSLERHGVDPLQETLQDSEMILFNMGGDLDVQQAFLQSIWEVQLRRDVEYAALSAVNEVFEQRTGREIREYPEGINLENEWLEIRKIPEDARGATDEDLAEELNGGAAATDGGEREVGYVEPETTPTGEISIDYLDGVARITEAGKQVLVETDSNRVPPSDTHRQLIRDGFFEWFTRAGFHVNILNQINSHTAADAEGLLPVNADTASLADARDQWESLEEDYPLLADLSKGREVAFEAEYSLQKPVGPIQNLARAARANRRPIFMVPDGRGDDRLENRKTHDNKFTYWADRLYSILNDPPLIRDITYHEKDERTYIERRLYTTSEKLRLSEDPTEQKYPVIARDKEAVWVEQDEAALVLYNGTDEDAKQRGRIGIDGLNDASANAFQVWCRYDQYEDEWVVYPEHSSNKQYENKELLEEDWQIVPRPFHPRTDIGEDYKEVDPLITILRDEQYIDSVESAMPVIYDRDDPEEDATLRPLIPEEYRQPWDAKHVPGYNPISDTPEALEGDINNSDRLELDEFLDTYETITDELDSIIPDTTTEYSPQYTPDKTFLGDTKPTDRRYWEKVFEFASDDHEPIGDVRLSISKVKEGITGGMAQHDQHEAAIRTGVKSGQLYVVNNGLMLASGWDRPKAVLPNPQKYGKRAIWADIYRQTIGEDNTIEKQALAPLVKGTKDMSHIDWGRATVEYAIAQEVLIPTDETDDPELKLCEPGKPEKWKRVWRTVQRPFDEPLGEQKLKAGLIGTIDDVMDFDDADEHIHQALHTNQTLKETPEGYVMTPPGEGGPDDPDELIADSDDDDGDGDGDGDDNNGGETTTTDADATSDTARGEQPNTGQSSEDGGGSEREGENPTGTDEQVVPDSNDEDGEASVESSAEPDAESPHPDEHVDDIADATVTDSDGATDGEREDEHEHGQATTDADESGSVGATTATNEPDSSADTAAETEREGDTQRSDADGEGSESENEDTAGEESASDDTDTDASTASENQNTSKYADWNITPTDSAPDGWLETYTTVIEAYHDNRADKITANQQWNALLTDIGERYYPTNTCRGTTHTSNAEDATTHTHDGYVPTCGGCSVEGVCTECDSDDTQPLVRIEVRTCGERCGLDQYDDGFYDEPQSIARADCEDCLERRYCVGCAATDDLAPVADVDTDADGTPTTDILTSDDPHRLPPATRPLIIEEQSICFKADHTHPDDGDDRCSCGRHEYETPVEHLPERAHDYYTGPEWDTGIAEAADDSLLAGHDPHSLYGGSPHTIGRSYDQDIVEEQYLGYAPRGSLIRHRLLKDGHSVEQLLATGLFVPDPHSTADVYEDYEDGDTEYTAEDLAAKDLKGDLADEDHPLEAKDLIRPRWKGRYIFPFMLPAEDLETLDDIFEFPFDVAETDIEAAATDDGKVPIFAYSRAQPHRIHPNDWRGSKYEKLKLTDYVYAHEAIYGIDSLQAGEPAIITEGVADAIAAKMHDLPVLSPVTTKIKSQHHEPLLELIEAYDVSGIYLIQDNEASNFAREEPGTLTPEDIDDITAHLTKRESILDSDSQDLESHVEAWTDDDRDASLELIDSRGDLAGGPLSPFLSIDPVSPGLDGALRTGRFLHQNDIRTLHIDLPQLATEKVDLDDYLTMGLHEYIPIFSGLQSLRWSLTARTEAALLQSLAESAAFTTAYQDGTTRLKNQLADHREIAPDTPEYEQLDIWNTTELGNSVPVDYRDDGTVDIPAPFEGNDGKMTYPTGDTEWMLKDDLTQRQILGVAHQTVSAAEDGSVPTPEQTLADILEASLDITVPATFDETILGELLASSPVAAVEELAENPHPRQPTHTTTPTAIRNRAESVADAGGNSGGSDESQPASDGDTAGADGERETLTDLYNPMNVGRTKPTTEFVPLFDPPKVVVPTRHAKFEDVMEAHTNQQTQSIAADGSGGSETASGDYSELYELELSDLVGKSPRYRGPNPLAHTGESRDYFLLSGDDFAYDFKRDAVFNALFYLAVEAKCRRVNDPEGSFDGAEHLAVWLHAKDQGYISSDDAIPNKALNQAAVEAGVADWSDIGAKTVETADGTIQFEAALPDDKYNEILEVFEDEFGVSPGRGQKVTEATFEVEGLTTEESAREFAQRYLTTDVPEEDYLKEEYDYPRTPIDTVWKVYKFWCEEVNGVDHKSEYNGSKKEIANVHDVERGPTSFGNDHRQCYKGMKFNDMGWRIHSLMQRDSETQSESNEE